MAWITQGRTGYTEPGIAPRHLEHLGVSDRGIILYREMLADALDAIEKGADPPGLVYDASLQDPMLPLHNESDIGEARTAFNLRAPDGSSISYRQGSGLNGGNGNGGTRGGQGPLTNERTMPLAKIEVR